MTFTAYLQSRRYRPATVEHYTTVATRYESGLLRTEDLGRSTWRIVTSALKHYADFLGDAGGKVRELLARIEEPAAKNRRPERPLEPEEYGKLKAAIDEEPEPDRSVLAAILHSGLRIGDVFGIERSAVVEAKKSGILFLECKGGTMREYPYQVLRDHVEPLLGLRWKRFYEVLADDPKAAYQRVYYRLRICAVRAGIDPKKMHPHLLRRTFAFYALKTTQNVEAVRQLLGHSSIATTQRYINSVDVPGMEKLIGEIDEKRFGK